MVGKTDSNQEPFRPRNQPLQNARYDSSPKNLPPRSHNFHRMAKKSCKSSAARQSAPVRTESSKDRHSGGPVRPRAVAAASVGPAPAPGLGVRSRAEATRAQRPHPHPSHDRQQWAERRVEEKRDNAGPGWRFRTLHGSPAPLPPHAASCRAKFAAPPSLLGPGGEAVAADLLPASPPPPSSPRGGSQSPRGGGARASRMGRAMGAGHAGDSRELQGRWAREVKGARKEAARTKGAGRAGERGARRSRRTRCRSGGFSNEAGSAPRFSVR